MDSYILNEKGYSVVELAVALGIIAILIVSIVSISVGRVNISKLKRTIKDMDAIAIACQQYYMRNEAWPAQLTDLQPDYISVNVGVNPFNQAYLLTGSSNLITISSLVPAGIANERFIGPQIVINSLGSNDEICITRPINLGISSRVRDR